MKLYSLKDFESILNNGISSNVPAETVDIINKLVSQVGSPEYIKTPQFKNNNILSNYKPKNIKFAELSDGDWDVLRSFKPTDIIKKEGINKTLDSFRKLLNKMTMNNYHVYVEQLTNELNNITTENDHEIIIIATEIFNIVSINILYSEIYAKLYKDLISKYDIFQKILIDNLETKNDKLYIIDYCCPETNYSKFCENNKNNEARRALCLFFVNLTNNKVLSEDYIANIIIKLLNLMSDNIKCNDKMNEVDEISEIIYIMVINSYKNISQKLYKKIYTIIKETVSFNPQNYPSLTNKCIFKFMDILDEIDGVQE